MQERDFYYLLYMTLLATCPVDTRNMVSHITLEDAGDHWIITISGPAIDESGKFFDYARAVNYGLNAIEQGRPMSTKESRNYKWIERAIKRASMLATGGTANYALY